MSSIHRGKFLDYLGWFVNDFLFQVIFGAVELVSHAHQGLHGDGLDVLDLIGRNCPVEAQLILLHHPGAEFQRRRRCDARKADDSNLKNAKTGK